MSTAIKVAENKVPSKQSMLTLDMFVDNLKFKCSKILLRAGKSVFESTLFISNLKVSDNKVYSENLNFSSRYDFQYFRYILYCLGPEQGQGLLTCPLSPPTAYETWFKFYNFIPT